MSHMLHTVPKHRILTLAVLACLLLPFGLALAQPTEPPIVPTPVPVMPPNPAALSPTTGTTTPPPTMPKGPPPVVPVPDVEFDTRTQERITNLAANLSNRHERTIERLTLISNRLKARIDILKAGGMDTAAAEAKLMEANYSLINIRGSFTDIDMKVRSAVSAKNGARAWRELSGTYIGSASVILGAYITLREVVYLLDPTKPLTPYPPAPPLN